MPTRDRLVTPAINDRVAQLTKSHERVKAQIRRMQEEEPLLFGAVQLDAEAIMNIIGRTRIPEEDVIAIQWGLHVVVSRLYAALQMASIDHWLDVEDMAARFLHHQPRGRSRKKGNSQKGPDPRQKDGA